jgi:hypothetical protein
MKKIYVFVLAAALFMVNQVQAQLSVLYVAPGETMYVTADDTLHIYGLGMTPNTRLDMSGISTYRTVDLANPDLTPAIKRGFTFTPSAPDFKGFVKFWYADSLKNNILENDLQLYYHTNKWNVSLRYALDESENVLNSNTLTILPNELTLASLAIALPMNWLQVGAQAKNNAVVVDWKTADENALEGYSVMHSIDCKTWNEVGTATAKGGAINQYSFVHSQRVVGKNFYRITSKDLSGKQSYSKVVLVNTTQQNTLHVYPNPSLNTRSVSLELAQPSLVKIWRMNGTVVYACYYTAGTHVVQVPDTTPGTYFISNGTETISLIIQ